MLIAITREVSPGIGRCELSHLSRLEIDLDLAQRQHRNYEALLEKLGCDLVRLPADVDLPDSVFVEDAAVVLDDLAVITRPGAEPRRSELNSIARTLRPYRPLSYIRTPGTLDGGDVLRMGRIIFVGRSQRTNDEGIAQLQKIASEQDCEVRGADVKGCLHLKSAVTQVAENTLLINPEWTNPKTFSEYDLIKVAPSEPFAANALFVNGRAVYPNAFPLTRRKLQSSGVTLELLDVSELAKAEGAVTCCALLFRTSSRSTTRILNAESEDQIDAARTLFREYAESLGFDLGFQDFEDEIADFPGQYSPPDDCLLIAELERRVVGCVALRRLEGSNCEMKRLYVRRSARGHGIGKRLASEIIEQARLSGYKRMKLDTISTMKEANTLYRELGFGPIEPYRFNPVPGAAYFELDLESE